jgi:hypothetical protein
VHQPPDNHAQRAQPESGGRQPLNTEANRTLFGGLRIAGHVEDAAGDPDQAQRRRSGIADVDREQPQRRQENRHPFQRVHVHAKHPLEVGITGGGRRLDAKGFTGHSNADTGVEVEQDSEAGDERGVKIHCEIFP